MRVALCLLAPVVLVACSSTPPPPVQGAATASAPAGAHSQAVPIAAHGAATPATPASAGQAISGTVVETMDSGGYTYMLVRTGSGDVWTAVQQTKVEKGATVAVDASMVMENFESKTLHRKFDKIAFGALAAPGGQANAHAAGAAATSGEPGAEEAIRAAHAAAPPPAPLGDVKIEKAAGSDGRRVSEVYAQRTALAGKTVSLRGKVVKFLPSIMNRNWLHLKDGSGTAGKDDDLTVTTNAVVAVGDVVLVKGTVRADKDFGSGYHYAVIVEDAAVTK